MKFFLSFPAFTHRQRNQTPLFLAGWCTVRRNKSPEGPHRCATASLTAVPLRSQGTSGPAGMGIPFSSRSSLCWSSWLHESRATNARAGWGAIALMTLIFVSPLCALSSALFSARVFHHVLLVAAIAPLFALAFPMRRLGSPPLGVLVAVHAAILWLWHAPGPYTWGLASVPAYWLMQTSLLASAWLLWRGIFAPTTQFGSGTRRVGSDDRSDGPSGRFDCFCAAAALPGSFFKHGGLGIEPTR